MDESNLKLKFQQTVDELFEKEHQTPAVRLVQDRAQDRRQEQSFYQGQNKRHQRRRENNAYAEYKSEEAAKIEKLQTDLNRLREENEKRYIPKRETFTYFVGLAVSWGYILGTFLIITIKANF